VFYKLRGKKEPIFDCISQMYVLCLGHAPSDINYAAALQAKKNHHVRSFALTPVRVKFNNLMAEIAPGTLKGGKVSSQNMGGGGAIEAAIRVAYANAGMGNRDQIVSFYRGFHGTTLGLAGGSLQNGNFSRCRPFGVERWVKAIYPYCYRCLWNYKNGLYGDRDKSCNMECLNLAKQQIENFHVTGILALLVELIQGPGGDIPMPVEFLNGITNVCKENDIITIYDESQTGCGRTGKMWATELYLERSSIDVSPDILVTTKGIAGGWPLGVTIAGPRIKNILNILEEHNTFSSIPTSLAVALTTLKIFEKHKIPLNAKKQGEKITKFIKELQEDVPQIGDIRGPGLFIGVELVKNQETREPFTELAEKFLKTGVQNNISFGIMSPIQNKLGEVNGHEINLKPGEYVRNVVKVRPPLIVNDEETELICQKFEKSLKDALKEC
jgi:4-aminobutyrate aminotransferase-like enzyme